MKESDRVAALVAMVRAFGLDAVDEGDALVLHGGRPRGGARVRSEGDHRIADRLDGLHRCLRIGEDDPHSFALHAGGRHGDQALVRYCNEAGKAVGEIAHAHAGIGRFRIAVVAGVRRLAFAGTERWITVEIDTVVTQPPAAALGIQLPAAFRPAGTFFARSEEGLEETLAFLPLPVVGISGSDEDQKCSKRCCGLYKTRVHFDSPGRFLLRLPVVRLQCPCCNTAQHFINRFAVGSIWVQLAASSSPKSRILR